MPNSQVLWICEIGIIGYLDPQGLGFKVQGLEFEV